MKNLVKKYLTFSLTIDYFLNSLKKSNYLSDFLVSVIDFTKGNFFTLLPDSADHEKIYEFSSGGILQQNLIQRGRVGSLPGEYEFSEIPSITDDLAGLAENFLQKDKENFCLIDDVIRDSDDLFKNNLNLYEIALFHDKEVYYLIDHFHFNRSLIVHCLRNSKAYWHSLCIFSKTLTQDIRNKILEDSKIRDICLNAQFLIVGAYDGEGYIFWEREETVQNNS